MSQDNQGGGRRVRPEYVFSIVPLLNPDAPSAAVEELTRQLTRGEEGSFFGELMRTVQESRDVLVATSTLLTHGVFMGQPMPPEALESVAQGQLADGVRLVLLNLLQTRFQRDREALERCPDDATEEGVKCVQEVINRVKQDVRFVRYAPILIHITKLHVQLNISHGAVLPLNRFVLERTTGHSVLVGKILMPEQPQPQQQQQGGGGLGGFLSRILGRQPQAQQVQQQGGGS